jgi:hypothetical protein
MYVATGRGGSAEYLRDGENCVLFPAGEAAAPSHTEERFNHSVERFLAEATGDRPPARAHAHA